MFPCSSGSNPFTYMDHGKSNSGQLEEHPSSYSHLPAPFLVDDHELFLSHLLSQQQLFVCSSSTSTASQAQTENGVAAATDTKKEASVAEQIPSKKKSKQTDPASRKRSGKKDRHSKICTAQGPRDRRMRLSLQIARKFFDLQDMLGFDKASKTIEWLFSKSKTAIKELIMTQVKPTTTEDGGANANAKSSTVSVTSDSEVVSQNGEFLSREKTNRKLHRVARDSRDKARARARERTREKLIIRGLEISKQMGHLWSSTSTALEETDHHDEMKSSLKYQMVDQLEQPANQIDSVSIINAGAPTTSSPNFNPQDDFPGFPANWDSNNVVNMQSICCRRANKNSIFMTTQSAQDQNPSSIFITSSNPLHQNPTSNILATSNNSLHSYFLQHQFS